MGRTVAVIPIDETMLIETARGAARHAHPPGSRIAVGAAALLTDRSIMTGVNFVNASCWLSLSAETAALATANSQARLADVAAVAVIGGLIGSDALPGGDEPVGPCGRCRRVLNEVANMGGRGLPAYCGSPHGDLVSCYVLSDLLHHAFGSADAGFAPKADATGHSSPRRTSIGDGSEAVQVPSSKRTS